MSLVFFEVFLQYICDCGFNITASLCAFFLRRDEQYLCKAGKKFTSVWYSYRNKSLEMYLTGT